MRIELDDIEVRKALADYIANRTGIDIQVDASWFKCINLDGEDVDDIDVILFVGEQSTDERGDEDGH